MRAWLRKFWESRAPRERIILAMMVLVVVAALYFLLVEAASRARARLVTSLPELRAQAARFESDATELERVRAARVPPTARTDLRSQVQAQAAAAGLGGALVRVEASGDDAAQVVFGSVPFGDWLAWVAALQTQHIRLSSARIEALSTPGLVGVTASFTRPTPP